MVFNPSDYKYCSLPIIGPVHLLIYSQSNNIEANSIYFLFIWVMNGPGGMILVVRDLDNRYFIILYKTLMKSR